MRKILLSLPLTKKEVLFVSCLAVFASFLSLAPTIWAYLKTPPGFWFSGFNFWFDPWDINSYFAYMRQGFNGSWLYQNPYTPSLSPALPVFSLYFLLGHLSRAFSLPIPFVYHLASLFLTILFFLIIYIFISFFVKEKSWRFGTLFLVAFGGGIGWLSFFRISFADVTIPDATTFQTLHLPHFVLDQSLFLAAILFSFCAILFKKWKLALTSSVIGIILAFIHPYSLFAALFILLGFLAVLILSKRLLSNVIYFLPQFIIWSTILFIFYALLFLKKPPVFIIATNEALSPSPLYFFLSYGFLSLLAIFGLYTLWCKRDEKSLFLFSWLIFHFLALYLPFHFQRLMLKSFFIILSLVAIIGLKKLGSLIKNPWPAYFGFFFFSTLTQMIMILDLFLSFNSSRRWVYLTKEEKYAFDFLLKDSRPGDVILASDKISNFIPAQTNNRVSSDKQVLRPEMEKEKTSRFYSGAFLSSPPPFMKKEKIEYVFWGPEEKELGDFDLTKLTYLENIYQNGKVTIFKVK